MSKKEALFEERFLVLQRESDLLSVDKWERLGLINQNPSSTPGEDRYMAIACFRGTLLSPYILFFSFVFLLLLTPLLFMFIGFILIV